jgi:hypothetical protein
MQEKANLPIGYQLGKKCLKSRIGGTGEKSTGWQKRHTRHFPAPGGESCVKGIWADEQIGKTRQELGVYTRPRNNYFLSLVWNLLFENCDLIGRGFLRKKASRLREFTWSKTPGNNATGAAWHETAAEKC